MPVKPAATVVLLLLTASQAPPSDAVSKFGIMSQDPEAPPVYVQYVHLIARRGVC